MPCVFVSGARIFRRLSTLPASLLTMRLDPLGASPCSQSPPLPVRSWPAAWVASWLAIAVSLESALLVLGLVCGNLRRQSDHGGGRIVEVGEKAGVANGHVANGHEVPLPLAAYPPERLLNGAEKASQGGDVLLTIAHKRVKRSES